MAEKRKGRTERAAAWKASTRPGNAGTGDGNAGADEAAPEVGSHFEGDFGADELPRQAAGRERERDLESTDPPGER